MTSHPEAESFHADMGNGRKPNTLSCRLQNLEVRIDHGLGNSRHDYVELVEWAESGKSCWTLAYFIPSNGDWDLKFVGGRPFAPTVDSELFMRLARVGQELSPLLAGTPDAD